MVADRNNGVSTSGSTSSVNKKKNGKSNGNGRRNGSASSSSSSASSSAVTSTAQATTSVTTTITLKSMTGSTPPQPSSMTATPDLNFMFGMPGGDGMPPTFDDHNSLSAITPEVKEATHRLAWELDDYLRSKHHQPSSRADRKRLSAGDSSSANNWSKSSAQELSDESIAGLQLATARKLRELLPTSRDLLLKAQECKWIPVLLRWLNLHDNPAVQVEALLALTNIAELCAQQSYYQHSQAQSSAMASAAQAAAAAVTNNAVASDGAATKGMPAIPPHFWADGMGGAAGSSPTAPTYPYPSLVTPAPGSVPFPPLSFSQTLSEDAVAAFDASLTSTIQNSHVLDAIDKSQGGFSLPPAPLFPSSSHMSNGNDNPALCPPTGGINFTSLAPPPGGAHNAVPSNTVLLPPTPASGASLASSYSSFPQQLSPSSQHLLLRHADAIPTLISLLSSPNREIYEQAMWILGSIAVGDSPTGSSSGTGPSNTSLDREKPVSARDVILAAGIMNQLIRCLEMHPSNLSLQRIGTWTLSNLVEGIFQKASSGATKISGKGDYSSSDEIDMASLLPVLRRLLLNGDAEVLSYTCWTLSHLCDGPSSHIAAVVTTQDPRSGNKGGLVPRLVDLLLHRSWRVTKPALRTIGNIVCAECNDDGNNYGSTADYTEVILECGAVPRLKELVMHSNREIQKEACWTLSNIAAGTINQIQAVIDSGAIPPLVALVHDKKTDQEVCSEACWVVLNATSCGSNAQIEVLVDQGCVQVLDVLLSEANLVMMALDGLERILHIEESREIIRRGRIENGLVEDNDQTSTPTLVRASMIETARDSHSSSTITKRADKIWKKHFVSCALCKNSFSKHRTGEASFCDECKCYVCFNCNCQVYHLSYQEELWAETEEKTQQKKSSKKNKNKKKKEKQKQKKAKELQQQQQQQQQQTNDATTKGDANPKQNAKAKTANGALEARSSSSGDGSAAPTSTTTTTTATQSKNMIPAKLAAPPNSASSKDATAASTKTDGHSSSNKARVEQQNDTTDNDSKKPDSQPQQQQQPQAQQPSIDFVLYLQQTGSIIALAKLMDALEYGDEHESLDDTELQLIKQQQQQQQQRITEQTTT